MSQDNSFVLNNKQPAQTQNIGTQNPAVPVTTASQTSNVPSSNPLTVTDDKNYPSSNRVNNLQSDITSLPNISTFSEPDTNTTTNLTQTDLPTEKAETDQVTTTIPEQNTSLPNEDLGALETTPLSVPNPPANNTTPDFRALAEEIMADQSSTNQSNQDQLIQVSAQNNNQDNTQPTQDPVNINAPSQPMLQPQDPVINNITDEPKLISDPFVQQIHEKDVDEEREALEILINSSRIDPELKEHLKIELLKFKNMETDLAPINQNINNINAEATTPEPETPIVNPIQETPPQQPM